MRRRRIVPLAAALLVGTAALLGSSTATQASSGSATANIAAAKAFVAKAMQPPKWSGPTSKVDIAKAKGKSVFFVNLTEEIPALHEWSVVLAQQLKAAGVNTQGCDAKGSPNGITTCLQQGLAAKPDVIVALALDNDFIASYMAKAKAAGIKFITGQSGRPELPTSPDGRVAEVTFDYYQVGRILGAWFAADSSCAKGAPQIVTTTSSRQPSAAEVAGMQSAIKQYCAGMKLPAVQNVLIPDWPTKLPTVTRSALLANKKLQYILPLYDGMTLYMNPSIKQMHVGHPVRMGSFNATPVVMQTEVSKNSPLVADVGGPNQWYGVALADQVLRVLTGAPPVKSENVPLRLFTPGNIKSINVAKDEATWYGKVNPICEYHKLWGLAC
jgi:ribose transport system substrate-binding protein